jgi:nucleotide-binding universal stress UspA family protein
MKLILIPVADRPECKAAMKQAFALAAACSGNVIGCHLRPPRADETVVDHNARFLGFRKWADASKDMSDVEIESNRKAAEDSFKRQAEKANFALVEQATLNAVRSAQWVHMVGSLDKLFSTIGPTSDVSVISRPKRGSKGPGSDFMLAALIETGKPVIVLPQTPVKTLGKRILIAWNQSIEAARAVTASMPLLQLAESVQIVSCGSEARPGPKAAALVDYLKYWGVKATCKRTKGKDAAQEIIDVFKSQDSDLIVMGAYSRGRFREAVFGGVTEDLLFDTPIPVLALHS